MGRKERRKMQLSQNARTVLEKRYLARDENGQVIETPEELCERIVRNLCLMDILYHPDVYARDGGQEVTEPNPVAPPGYLDYSPHDMETLGTAYARLARRGCMKVTFPQLLQILSAERESLAALEDELYNALAGLEFMFNSPTLMNAGRELQQLSACFVLPVEDSMDSIFDSLKNTAMIHKSGGGTGFSFSRLRPKNDQVRSTGGVASGPVSFMKVYDAATEAVKQGGTRRGANMGILRCDHPDIEEFIRCKAEDTSITNFNISVGITDEFMRALAQDEEYPLISPRHGAVVGYRRARDIFQLIVEMAWKNGEPGIIFLDRLNADNPTPQLGPIESTNPCGEQPLLPYESCNLGSINLACLAKDGQVDYARLAELTHLAVHLLDNVIDANRYPIPKIEEMTAGNRKIGLGVMGWADLLIKLGIPYDSERALALAQEVMSFIRSEARRASAELAAVRGPFPNFPGSALEALGEPPLRNATLTTIAPTGTISIICGASSGIEPLFALAFTRNVLDGQRLLEVYPPLAAVAKEYGFEDLLDVVAERGSVRGLAGVPQEVQDVFVTALEVAPEWHVRMQAAFQAFTDNAVSKTVNLPNQATKDDVAEIYQLAYELGCKGITLYRDGSRQEQVLSVGKGERKANGVQTNGYWGKIRPVDRPQRLCGFTDAKRTPMGNLYLTLNVFENHPFEMFAQIGKAGSDVTAFTEAIARLISLAFRCGIDPAEVSDQLIGIGGSQSVGFGPNRVRSVPDGIGQFIKECLLELETAQEAEQPGSEICAAREEAGRRTFNLCPSCGMNALIYEEGCAKCVLCGYSQC
ncbi:MAG TPA: vitamin B12-dependent ribonucleotide reductase [Firmicutes bacterium]|jgi:ribonucleoside-diphosphate reductase alpha chain|nr:vitamin B12-dependent ribonucleotide reductase [Bacillota bacterium]